MDSQTIKGTISTENAYKICSYGLFTQQKNMFDPSKFSEQHKNQQSYFLSSQPKAMVMSKRSVKCSRTLGCTKEIFNSSVYIAVLILQTLDIYQLPCWLVHFVISTESSCCRFTQVLLFLVENLLKGTLFKSCNNASFHMIPEKLRPGSFQPKPFWPLTILVQCYDHF